ncbi:MraY family glycosyltransferase [Confluentibacter sediminis]|uniref:MraY family glycosyltransferase n=1 Tax=Confluentibacter sediminis TaxID=2219045 RepID=UPI000DAEA2B4|nr:MraY family glycosyltransferase [Confluentibacter sediminis]
MNIISKFLNEYIPLATVMIILVSYFISLSVFPVIIYLNLTKKLSKKPNNRSSHVNNIPTLGGIPIFISIIVTTTLLTALIGNLKEMSNALILNISLVLLFFVGIKDDILEISSRKKFATQCLSTLLIIICSQIKISSFQGIIGIHDLHRFVSIVFTLFVFTLIINAFNLIDGIDGLAGSLTIIISLFFGVYHLLNKNFVDGFFSFAIIGATLAFLKYNISNHRKIFMGDTGSMTIGFLLAYQSVSLLSMQKNTELLYQIHNTPVFILALLSFPLFDTFRVFIIRIKNKKNPFSADRNHLHHKLIDLGLSHLQATGLITLYTIFITSITFIFQDFNINTHLVIVALLSTILLLVPFFIKRKEDASKFVFPFF